VSEQFKAGRDYILINRVIDRALYYDLSSCVEQNKKNEECSIFLTTTGGDPHAAFRMGRCVRNSYRHVRIVVPSICKSAGTLFAISANELAVGDNGELGPLDVQVEKPEELAERNSGLDILNALSMINGHAMSVFRAVLQDVRYGARLSTKLAAEYAAKMAIGSVEPLYAQIDPTKLSEMNRAMLIASEYGYRLNEYGNNLRDDNDALGCLLMGYPDHGFVIDRKEARSLFKNVFSPSTLEKSIYTANTHLLFDPRLQNGPSFINESVKSIMEKMEKGVGEYETKDNDSLRSNSSEQN